MKYNSFLVKNLSFVKIKQRNAFKNLNKNVFRYDTADSEIF